MNSYDFNKKDTRFYKVKNPSKEFLCALCNTKRQMRYTKHLNIVNYYQIVVSSGFLVWLLWDLMSYKAFSLFFIIWTTFEVVKKMLYRKEIPCPHCGFDATWYRRDVKVARNKVENFWKISGHDDSKGKTLASLEQSSN